MRIRVRAAWSIASKRLALECEQRCRGLLQLHAWVPVAELPAADSLQEICLNGFRAGHSGVSFHVGNLRLPGCPGYGKEARAGRAVRSRGGSLPQGRRLYEFLLCRVGVGRSYMIDSAQHANVMDLPPEYDSFFIRHDSGGEGSLDTATFTALPSQVLHHEYIVRDATQALPLYLVHFEFDPEEEEKLGLPLCALCGSRPSQLYCEADEACFCSTCDAKVHGVSAIARNHVRVEVNRRPRGPGNCPEHRDTEADEYCLECRVPLCPHCRRLGNHSAGAAAEHPRLPMAEAYEHLLGAPRGGGRALPGVAERKAAQERVVSRLDGKLADVQEAGRRAEDQLYDSVQRAVNDGQDLAAEQARLLLSDELEAKRRLEQAAWLEGFFEENVKRLPASTFLRSWLQHTAAREEVDALAATAGTHVGASLRVDGGLWLAAGVGDSSRAAAGDASPRNDARAAAPPPRRPSGRPAGGAR